MKYSITPSPTGNHVAKNGRRVTVIPAENGKDYESEAAFLTSMGIQPFDLVVAKQTAVAKLQQAHEKSLREGIAPDGAEFALPAEIEWQNKFTGMVTLLQTALLAAPNKAAKDAILAAPSVVPDKTGAIHSITNQDLLNLLSCYGQKIQTKEVVLATKQAEIAAATSLTDLAPK